MAAVEAKKAIDRVHRLKLFKLLSDRKNSFFVLKMDSTLNVCFTEMEWRFFLICHQQSGMLPGGILSPQSL